MVLLLMDYVAGNGLRGAGIGLGGSGIRIGGAVHRAAIDGWSI